MSTPETPAPAPAPAVPAAPKWSFTRAAKWAYNYALAHPHAVITYAVAIYTAVHRAGV